LKRTKVHQRNDRKNLLCRGRPIGGCNRIGSPFVAKRGWRKAWNAEGHRDSFQRTKEGAEGLKITARWRRSGERGPASTVLGHPFFGIVVSGCQKLRKNWKEEILEGEARKHKRGRRISRKGLVSGGRCEPGSENGNYTA